MLLCIIKEEKNKQYLYRGDSDIKTQQRNLERHK